ncbi:MAG: DUF5677 domain-containing protein [Gammaproteobacteria bacterium]|nr:DUF5677 domain-containing protein [Gammaproteobacteria bacterium]
MNISDRLQEAKEIGSWLHGKVNNISVPNDKRTVMALSILQQALDVTDGLVILLENNLPGPALALARPMHEGYVRGVWLLAHASEESVERFETGRCPNFPELLKQIGDDPETGGAFIKGMTDLNLSSFHDLTHGGMEHVIRRTTGSAIEPNYSEDEIINLIKIRNQYSMLITCFLLLLANDQGSMEELLKKREEWRDAL